MDYEIFEILNRVIYERSVSSTSDSYTNKLLNNGENAIIKKLGEENAELIRAFLKQGEDELAGEAADYLYHLMVALRFRGVGLEKVAEILTLRHEHKKR